MSRRPTIHPLSNETLASILDEIAQLLERQGADRYRVSAYRNAACTIRRSVRPLFDIYKDAGPKGLEELPGIGPSLAGKIGEALCHGRSRVLERLRHRQATGNLLTTLPTIGPRLAERIRRTLGVDSLEEVLRAARDGRLRRVAGFGHKRVQAIRQSLASRLNDRPAPRAPGTRPDEPSVVELLEIDRQYRRLAGQGRLVMVRPRNFNPTGAAWLPVWHTQWKGRRIRAHYANTARCHRWGRVRDWVVITCEDKQAFGRWTVVTATHGPLRGRRVVQDRERECQAHYGQAHWEQLSLPVVETCQPDGPAAGN